MPELSQLTPGTMLGDRYRIDELISIGGMGAVYSASHMFLNKRLAIKVLRNDLPGAEMMADRFRREAIAASAIGHENIIRVTDMGLSPHNTPYLVMELLHGRDLADALEDAPFAISRATQITCAILRGLGAAHRAGIVHRDLKPENVFLSETGGYEVVKILDFGVSLLERPEVPNTRLTSTGVVVGTPRYMSPEQARGDIGLTGAVDIYAAGVVLYEMLTREHPYKGSNYNVVVHQIIAGDWTPIETRRGGLPPGLVAVVERAMSIEPTARYACADDMADALEPFTSFDEDVTATHKIVPPAATAEHSGVPRLAEHSADEPAWTSTPRQRGGGGDGGDGFGTGERDRHFTVNPEYTGREKKGQHNIAIAMVAAIAVVGGVFLVLNRTGGGDDNPAAADAGVIASAADAQTDIGKPGLPAADAAAVAAADPAVPDPIAADAAPDQPDTKPDKPDKKPDKPDKPDTKPDRDDRKSSGSSGDSKRGKVTITFLVLPPSTRVSASAGSVSGKQLTIDRGKRAISVKLQAEGYVSQSVSVVPDRNRDVVRQLKREPEPPEINKPEPPEIKKPDEPEPEPREILDPAPKPDPDPAPAPSPNE